MKITKEQMEAIEYLEKYTKWETYGERNLEKDIITVLELLRDLYKDNLRYEKELHNTLKYSISKEKLKDKIEELNQYYKKEIYPSLYQWSDITITEHYDEMIELLHELLGDE